MRDAATNGAPALDATHPMVRLDQVAKAYGTVQALRPIDLEVRKGEFLTLLGPSGSGKTTLLNMIAGMTGPSQGRVWIDGRDVTETPPAKRGIGMVFQNYALMPHMTIFQNIAFPLQIRRVPAAEIRRRVTKVLEIVRLPHVAGRKPRELSGGQQQRVSLARCIVYNPSLILMDEPLGALDKNLREQMQLEIRRLHTELGITMVYVTHDQEEALNMSDRIMLMNGGAAEQLATPHELYFAPCSRFAAEFIGTSSLVPAEITGPGMARLVDGTTVVIARGATTGLGHVMIRPESMRLTALPGGASTPNAVHGTLQDTLVTGGTVKHFVTLRTGEMLVIQELENEHRTNFEHGQAVSVSWPVNAAIFLDR
jgi:putative spermidine/putrescine transport system ATP-binding protein